MASLPVLIAAAVGGLSAFTAIMLYLEMIDKINEHMPERDRFSWYWWGTEVRRKYKSFCPAGRLIRLADTCLVLMVVCFFIILRYWVFANPPIAK